MLPPVTNFLGCPVGFIPSLFSYFHFFTHLLSENIPVIYSYFSWFPDSLLQLSLNFIDFYNLITISRFIIICKNILTYLFSVSEQFIPHPDILVDLLPLHTVQLRSVKAERAERHVPLHYLGVVLDAAACVGSGNARSARVHFTLCSSIHTILKSIKLILDRKMYDSEKSKKSLLTVLCSVADSFHLDLDPDISFREKMIWIRLQIRVIL